MALSGEVVLSRSTKKNRQTSSGEISLPQISPKKTEVSSEIDTRTIVVTKQKAVKPRTKQKPRIKKMPQGKVSVFRSFFTNCLFVLIGIGLAFLLAFFAIRDSYSKWEIRNKAFLTQLSDVNGIERSLVRKKLDERLKSFQDSMMQKESVTLDCNMISVLFLDVFKSDWPELNIDNVGTLCGKQYLDLYIHMKSKYWINFRLWQRTEGKVDFNVYSISFGDFSLSSIANNWIGNKMSEGVSSALKVILNKEFSGRKIDEMYLTDAGVRMVGSL